MFNLKFFKRAVRNKKPAGQEPCNPDAGKADPMEQKMLKLFERRKIEALYRAAGKTVPKYANEQD
jgi:hypothetical protein